MRAPAFWQQDGWQAAALAPFEAITAQLTARRVARPGWEAPVPVLCCGNATAGGSGKTPLALDILRRLRRRGVEAHALTRGHGGAATTTQRVDHGRHDAAEVGDEALLLAEAAPCWAGADRADSARAAIEAGAQVLVMDDGLQNPSLRKSAAILVIDGGAGFGNGHLLPAGPLREPVAAAAARCQLAVMIGGDRTGAQAALPPHYPMLHARMAPGPAMRALAGRRVMAFAGIGRPAKFFDTLAEAGVSAAATLPFADHHRYTARDLDALRRQAAREGAMLVTTTKDFVRIPATQRHGITALDAAIVWQDEAAFETALRGWVP
jgi:tetraacyldisaccharide 4'-kinase